VQPNELRELADCCWRLARISVDSEESEGLRALAEALTALAIESEDIRRQRLGYRASH
jgi:hypothetical protein